MEFNIKNLDKENKLHHFNIIEGGNILDVNQVCSKVLCFDYSGNKNYFLEKYQEFKIDDARKLINLQNLKHKNSDTAVYIIDCNSINVSAQNALLKIFEETSTGNYFFFLIPNGTNLLPTFLSRAEFFKNTAKTNLISDLDYFKLKDLPLKDRLLNVNKIIADIKKEKINKSDVVISMNYLLKQIDDQILNGNKELITTLDTISSVSGHLSDNGASVKSILEFVMLNI